jgi:hypothetical protein
VAQSNQHGSLFRELEPFALRQLLPASGEDVPECAWNRAPLVDGTPRGFVRHQEPQTRVGGISTSSKEQRLGDRSELAKLLFAPIIFVLPQPLAAIRTEHTADGGTEAVAQSLSKLRRGWNSVGG